jgi:hypothetical protein
MSGKPDNLDREAIAAVVATGTLLSAASYNVTYMLAAAEAADLRCDTAYVVGGPTVRIPPSPPVSPLMLGPP